MDVDELIQRLKTFPDNVLEGSGLCEEAAAALDRLQRENAILRNERDHTRAHYHFCIRVLTRIHGLILPEDVALPDGRRFEFNNPAIEHEMLRALSEVIRAIPDELKKAESQQPNEAW